MQSTWKGSEEEARVRTNGRREVTASRGNGEGEMLKTVQLGGKGVDEEGKGEYDA